MLIISKNRELTGFDVVDSKNTLSLKSKFSSHLSDRVGVVILKTN